MYDLKMRGDLLIKKIMKYKTRDIFYCMKI